MKKFEETGSVFAVKHGAPQTVRTPENLQRVREAFERSPRPSARQHSRILGVSRRSLFRMLKEIKFHPYKLQVVQQRERQGSMSCFLHRHERFATGKPRHPE